ncbi:MAG TPA: polysaccharide deacetylase family protein [Longimicrobiales bacterium]
MTARTARAAVAALALLAAPAAAQSPVPRQASVQERLGYPADARLLVIHADDFGMSHSVNRAIIDAFEHGWITSASLLVPCPWFPEAAAWARAHPDADLGIHLALTSEWTTYRWGPISGRDKVRSLLDAQGYLPLVEGDAARQAKPKEAERELRAQVDFARAAGVHITHLDSHMGTLFQTQPLFRVYGDLGRSYGLPRLLERQGGQGAPARPWEASETRNALIDRSLEIGPGVPPEQWLDAYEKMLAPLPPGVYQLIVHLAYDDAELQGATADHPNWGAAWRQRDLDMVRSDVFRDFLKQQGFRLITWHELARAQASATALR